MPFNADKAEQLRQEIGLSQQEAAERAGLVSRQRWNNLITRGGNIELRTLEAVAAVLGVKACDLITEPKKPTRKK